MIGLDITDQHWIDEALCGSVIDDFIWFDHSASDRPKAVAEAHAICGECPVKDECYEYAVVNKLNGIWAGSTDNERKLERRRRNKVTPPTSRCLNGHDTSDPDARDSANRCRQCRRDRLRKGKAA